MPAVVPVSSFLKKSPRRCERDAPACGRFAEDAVDLERDAALVDDVAAPTTTLELDPLGTRLPDCGVPVAIVKV